MGTAFKLEASGTALESKSPERNVLQTDAEKPEGTADVDLPAETAAVASQAVSQTTEASQGTSAPAAPTCPADEEAVSPELKSQTLALAEREDREELKAEKPAEKSK